MGVMQPGYLDCWSATAVMHAKSMKKRGKANAGTACRRTRDRSDGRAVVTAREIALGPLDLEDPGTGIRQAGRTIEGGHGLLHTHHQQTVQRSRHVCAFLLCGGQHATTSTRCDSHCRRAAPPVGEIP